VEHRVGILPIRAEPRAHERIAQFVGVGGAKTVLPKTWKGNFTAPTATLARPRSIPLTAGECACMNPRSAISAPAAVIGRRSACTSSGGGGGAGAVTVIGAARIGFRRSRHPGV